MTRNKGKIKEDRDIFLFSISELIIVQKYVFLLLTMINIKHNTSWSLSLTLIISFIVFSIFILTQSLIVLILANDIDSDIDMNLLAYSHLGLISTISSIIGLLFIVFFIKIKQTDIKSYLQISFPKITQLLMFVVLSLMLMFFMELFSNYYPDVFESDFVFESYKNADNLYLFYIGVVFLGPLFEEVLFRGFLFKGLENSLLGGHGAVFVSAFIFSIIHIQYGFWIILFMLLPMAILLGYSRLKTKSVLLPVLLHSLNNLITCLVTHFEIY